MARQKQFPCTLWTIGSPFPCSPTRRWAKRFAAASAWGCPLFKAERRDRDNLTHIGVASSSFDLLLQVSSTLRFQRFLFCPEVLVVINGCIAGTQRPQQNVNVGHCQYGNPINILIVRTMKFFLHKEIISKTETNLRMS